MIESIRATRGIAVAPHALAAQSALGVLREGGNAVEAMVSAAATIAIVYPHMNSIGGDGFWLIAKLGEAPIGIDACGAAASSASIDWYRERGITSTIPFRGGVAANTVAGTLSGWQAAIEFSQQHLGGRLPLSRLLSDAIYYAESGIAVTRSQAVCTHAKLTELANQPGFAATFLQNGAGPGQASVFRQPKLAATLRHLANKGIDDAYRGELAASIASDLAALGSPISATDLANHQARIVKPLELAHSRGTIFNMTPPTQGVVSLMILGILDAIGIDGMDPLGADYVHHCVEATKQAFVVRDQCVTDPAYMSQPAQSLLDAAKLQSLAGKVDARRAAPWGKGKGPGDTVWMGVIDGNGVMVSFIQSIYHEFGAGIVLPGSGINWQNRGTSFSLDPAALNVLRPGRKPFHTLNPAMARLSNGRSMVYGTMGGDGQPQSQCAVFTRQVIAGMHPQEAINAPRWLLGRTWGQATDTLKLEARFTDSVVAELAARGHDVEVLAEWDESMGHAGSITRHANGVLEGGADPRSDGGVAGY